MQSGEVPSSKYPGGHLQEGSSNLLPAQLRQIVGVNSSQSRQVGWHLGMHS